MDTYVEEVSYGDNSIALSYDDGTAYEEQVAALPTEPPRSEVDITGLMGRISRNKVYLPPDSMSKGKRKRGVEEEETMEEDEEVNVEEAPNGLRQNALYLRGSPITHLPTNNIFGYARYFHAEPVGLEWIDDSSCVLVFSTNAACKAAFEAFRRSAIEETDFDDCVSAKPIPVVLWPAKDRIAKTLGMAEGLEGTLLVRIARMDDKKVRGAKDRSAFYRKHGMDAGKDPNVHGMGRGVEKRRRTGGDEDEEKRRQLDDELDNFLRDEDDRSPSPLAAPPSKMRSDFMTDDGRELEGMPERSLLDRTSLMRAHAFDGEPARGYPQNGNRSHRGRRGQGRREPNEDSTRPSGRRPRRGDREEWSGRTERPTKTRQELDDELDAFLNQE